MAWAKDNCIFVSSLIQSVKELLSEQDRPRLDHIKTIAALGNTPKAIHAKSDTANASQQNEKSRKNKAKQQRFVFMGKERTMRSVSDPFPTSITACAFDSGYLAR